MNDDLGYLEEGSQTPFTREDVEEGVKDWKNRLGAFFKMVGDWAEQNGWRVDKSRTVLMHEEPMQKFDVPETEQPTMRLDRENAYALFKPKGLWVIGANGRIDLYTSKGTFVIIDLAEHGTLPRWTIFRATDRPDGDTFTPEMIAKLV